MWKSPLRALALTALSAVLFGLSFPPVALKPLAWVALVPYLVALRPLRLRGRILLGGVAGVLFAYSVGQWFARSVSTYYGQPRIVGAVVFLVVAVTMVSPYYVAFASAYGFLARRFRRTLPLLAASAWVGADLLRARLFTGSPFFIGNPWALLGYSQVGVDSIAQVASLTGVYGITFALVAGNAGLAEAVFVLRSHGRRSRELAALLLVAASPGVSIWLYGWMTLRAAPPSEASGRRGGRTVAIVQPNLPLGNQWRPELYGANLESHLRLSHDVMRRAHPRAVFWPEAAMIFFLEDEPLYRMAIARVLHLEAVELVAGGPALEDADRPIYYNSVFVLSDRGEVRGRYDKEYLVPFAEYFPAGIDLLRRDFGETRVFTPGRRTSPLTTRVGRAGVLVCNEGMLPEVAGQRVAEGATYLLNPSNDTWISDPGFVRQQFEIVSLRAVEQRRDLVRVSTSGPSAIVDPWGRVLVEAAAGASSAISGEVVERKARSVYGRVGDLFALLCLAAATLGVVRVVVPTIGRRGAAHGHAGS